jgi:predicted negative regulator of RcsB-dependent stress response
MRALPPRPGLRDPEPDVLAARLSARLERRAPRRIPRLAWAIPAAACLVVLAVPAIRMVATGPDSADPGERPGPLLSGAGRVTAGGPDRDPGLAAIAVQPGDGVEAADGEARLTDPDVGTLVLAPGTHLRIQAWGLRTIVFLESGSVEATVRPRGPGEGFEVRTDLAHARVVGTRFVVDHRPGERTEVHVFEGTVSVASPSGEEVARLPAGGVARLGPGGPTRDADIDPAPALPCRESSCPPIDIRPATAETRVRAGSRTSGSHAPPWPSSPVPAPVPGPVADLMARVRALATVGGEHEAIATLSRALATYPDHRPRLLALLGDLHRASGRPDEARAAWEEAIASWPGAAPEGLHADLARALEERGRTADAALAWEACLLQYPHGRLAGRALERLAAIQEATGHTDRALALRTRLLDEAPQSPEAVPMLAAIGLALRATGDLDGAAAWFAARTHSGPPALAEAALVGLMRVRLDQGRASDVRALAAQHADRFPSGLRAAEVARVVEALGSAR